jgi:two-component system cell cycle sensor histidine kinase/response regulator CckA
MRSLRKSRWVPYACAILGTAVAVVCRLLIPFSAGTGIPVFYGILYGSITAAAVTGGLAPAIVATLLGAGAADYYLLPPQHAFGVGHASQVGLALFLGLAALMISVSERQRRKHQQQIAAMMRAETEATRASEERFRRLVQVSAQTVWIANARGEVTAVDPPFFSGTSASSLEQRAGVSNWLDAVHPEDRERAAAAWRHSVETATPYRLELRFRNESGEFRHMASQAAPVFNSDGTVREWIGMSTDITDRKQAEQALAEAIQRLDAHMANSPLAVIEFDPQMRITRWSDEAHKLFGWSAAEVLGRPMFELPWVFEDDLETVRRVAQGMLDGTRPRNLSVNRNRRKDGAVIECEWHNSAIYDGEGKLASILSQVLNVTERKRAEERLRQAQKMESIAVLAGGVAHDFNNLLVGVIGNASLALDMEPPDSPTVELLQAIISSGEHAARLTKQMLDYSGKGRLLLGPVDLSQVVREVTALVRASVPKEIAIALDLDPALPAIEADRTQMHQVLLNLVINAAEAIGSESGTISVRTGRRRIGEEHREELGDAGIHPGEYVFLEVRDTGAGMDEATREKIFDPFFTTKFTGRGLGLAAVSGIVRGHKGSIRVSSAPGAGAAFTVLLPVAPEADPPGADSFLADTAA